MAKRTNNDKPTMFVGFDRPESNYFRMPNTWTDLTAGINSIAELKVVEYILRHTWGYHEYGVKKHITIDEFVYGRRRVDGERMDLGTGLSERAVYDGIRKAVGDGLIEEETDSSDRGRVKKSYSLRMRDSDGKSNGLSELQDLQVGVQTLQGVQSSQGQMQTLPGRGAKSAPRSEKETEERIDLSNIRKTSRQKKNGDQPESPTVVGGGDRSRHRRTTPGSKTGEDVARATGMISLGEAIAKRQAQHAESRRPRSETNGNDQNIERVAAPSRARAIAPRQVPQQDEVYQVIQAYIADFSRELNDRAPLRSSTTRAYNLYKRSGLDQDAFIAQLYAARAIVKERAAMIRTQGDANAAGFPVKHRAGYYFAVLEDLLGLRESSSVDDEQGRGPTSRTR